MPAYARTNNASMSDNEKSSSREVGSRSDMMKLRRENAALRNRVREMTRNVDRNTDEDSLSCRGTAIFQQVVSSLTMNHVTQVEYEWSSRLSSLNADKNREIELLTARICGRDKAIESLEHTAKMQVDTIHALSEDLEKQTSKLRRIRDEMNQKDSLAKLQNERLKDNSVTIANMLRTITKQNQEMASLRSELEKLKQEKSLCSWDQKSSQLDQGTSDTKARAVEILDAWHREQNLSTKARAA